MLLALPVLSGCSSSTAHSATMSTKGPTPAQPKPVCHRVVTAPVAVRVPGVASDWTLTSFDGTKIRMHWFPLVGATTKPMPTLLMGPGWGSGGDTDTTPAPPNATSAFGGLKIASLQQHGYNVLTWDPRGFGRSAGAIEADSADFEGRDVQRMLDWVSTRHGVLLDSPGDPRVGMLGGSYGGGIQLVTAARDCRVDAIVPTIAWHSLATSLYKSETFKSGWGDALYAAAINQRRDPHITHSYRAVQATGTLNADDRAWYRRRGPDYLLHQITIPTLFVQGTVDTLFTLDEAISNYRELRSRNVPTGMLWYCGGHGTCLTAAGDQGRPVRATLAWLDHYVKRDASAAIGPAFDFIDQRGTRFTAGDYPPAVMKSYRRSAPEGQGRLSLVATGGSGAGLVPARASNAVNVRVVAPAGSRSVTIVGAPRLTLTYRGTTPAGVRPTRVFAQLVDDANGLVLGNQITPIPVTLDGKTHTLAVPLEVVAFTMKPGSHLTLQLVASTGAYAQPRLGGQVAFALVRIDLPLANL
jgi:ABC-2 type transport system ATP-binding protein